MTQELNIEFDYKGIDESGRPEQILKNLNQVEDKSRNIYLERLQTFNKETLEQNPEPFRFLRKDNCSIIATILPYEFDMSQAIQTYILSTPGHREEKVLF